VYEPIVAESRLRGMRPNQMGSQRIMMLSMLIMNLLLKMLRIVMRMNQFYGSNKLFQLSPKPQPNQPLNAKERPPLHPMYLFLHPYHDLELEVRVILLCCPCQKIELKALSIRPNWPLYPSNHPPKPPSNQFYLRNLPKNRMPQNKYLN